MSTKRMERVFPLLMTVLMIATAFIPAVSAAEPSTSNVDTTSWRNTSAEIESAGEPGADTSPATDITRVVTGSGKIRLKTYDPETRTIRITDEGRSAADGDLEIRLVNTTPDLGTFTEIFEITAHSTIALDESEDFRATWALHNGEENATRAEWFVWENRLHTVEIPIIEYRNVTLEINTSENRTFENVTRGETLPETATVREPYIAGTETREQYWYEWVPFDPAGQTLNAGEARTFKVVYTKPAEIGQVDINTAPVFRGVACPEMTWWNTAWTARVPITITNPPAVDNYSHCEVVSFRSGMQNDFDDVRFVTDDGTVLDYWKESYTASDSAVIWVNLPAGATSIWMYYGNTAATDTGDPNRVFILYDGFDGPSLDTTLWTDTTPGAHYFSNGWIYDARSQSAGVLVSNDNVITDSEPVIVEMHIHADSLASSGYACGMFPGLGGLYTNGMWWYKQSSNWCRYVLVNGVASWRPGASRGLAVGGDYYNTWIITPSSQTHTVSGSASFTDVFAGTTGISNHRMYILGGDNSVSGRVMRMDWIRARKYVETEPAFAYGTPEFEPPVANFTASPTTGAAPLTVQFTDTSTGSPTSWAWDFGDTGTSTDQHPIHIYSSAGTYTVTLNVSNACGYDTSARPLITVTSDQTVMNPAPSFGLPNTLILREGKNFVSTPRYLTSGHDTAGTVFPDFGTAVRGYRFENGQTVILTAQDEIRPLEGYILYSDGYHEIHLQFEDPQIHPTVTKDLDEGWNLVGFYGLSQESARDTLISLRNAWSEAKGWDAGSQEYETSFVRDSTGDTSDQRLMYPGKAYLVYMTEEGTLSRSYYRTYSFCAEWVGDYHGMQNPLPSAEEEAEGFYDTLAWSSSWTGQFINGNDAAMERHWKDPAFGGVDSDYIDNTHLAFFVGHGWEGGFVFGTEADDYNLEYDEARWGNTKTDWIILGSCSTLNASTCREYWGPAFEGLHSICGFDTTGGAHPDMGWYFAQKLMNGETIKKAWFMATDRYVFPNDGSLRSAILAADIDGDLSTPDCLDDHIYGYGSSINPPGDPPDFQYETNQCEQE